MDRPATELYASPLVLGIDPGANGGVGIIDGRGKFVWCFPIRPGADGAPSQETIGEFRNWLIPPPGSRFSAGFAHVVGLEEPVKGFGRSGLFQTSAVAMAAGAWVGILAAWGLQGSLRLFPPTAWQKRVGLSRATAGVPRGERNLRRKVRKQASKDLAVSLFGRACEVAMTGAGDGVHDGMADALLIAEVRRQFWAADHLGEVS